MLYSSSPCNTCVYKSTIYTKVMVGSVSILYSDIYFLVLIFNILEAMSNPLITTAVAVGKMKGYQLRIAPLILLNLPISYAMLKYGCPPETVFIISIIISILTLFIRLKFLSRFFNIGIKDYIKNVLLRVLFVMVTSYSIPSFLPNIYKSALHHLF